MAPVIQINLWNVKVFPMKSNERYELEVDKSWEYSKMKDTAVFGIAVPFL